MPTVLEQLSRLRGPKVLSDAQTKALVQKAEGRMFDLLDEADLILDELFRLYDDDSLRPESLYGENIVRLPWPGGSAGRSAATGQSSYREVQVWTGS